MKTKYCPQCERELPASKFARMDAHCPCKDCQREHGYQSISTTTTPQSAVVRVRHINRRHSDKTPRNAE